LASHDPLRHIAVQILQFSLSLQHEPLHTKKVLYGVLDASHAAKTRCAQYATTHDFRNLDHLLAHLVSVAPFAALVIIDEMPEGLESVLTRSFQFGVEALELGKYEGPEGKCIYQFTPFLADVDVSAHDRTDGKLTPTIDSADIDTVVIPAKTEGFNDVFLGEGRWHAVRIHGTMRPQIRYIAAYQVAPIQAITHIAPVKSIEPWNDTNKVVINFAEPANLCGNAARTIR